MSKPDYIALQNKICTVTLTSAGGTNYVWCLNNLPQELSLFNVEKIPVPPIRCGSPVETKFYFFVLGSHNIHVELNFSLICYSEPHTVAETCTVSIGIVPADSEEFVSATAATVKVDNMDTAILKYGYPIDNPCDLYGYPCTDSCGSPAVACGYPTGANAYPGADSCCPPMLAYGYPGWPGWRPFPIVKYGYPLN